MDTYPQDYPHGEGNEPIGPAVVAAIIVIALLWALMELSQRPRERADRVAAAEQACAHLSYVNEREACIERWMHNIRADKD